jgi:hypothetical protein
MIGGPAFEEYVGCASKIPYEDDRSFSPFPTWPATPAHRRARPAPSTQ